MLHVCQMSSSRIHERMPDPRQPDIRIYPRGLVMLQDHVRDDCHLPLLVHLDLRRRRTVPSGIFRNAPNPNAAKLFQSYFFSAEAQQMLVDVFAHRSFHAQVKEKGEHVPLSSLKLLKADPAQVKNLVQFILAQ